MGGITAFCVAFVLTFSGLLEARPFSRIIAFGDSLIDIGNTAKITIDGNSPRIKGYYKETHYSDNVIWIARLAIYWDMPKPRPGRGATTSFPVKRRGTDWAWGGAEALPGYRRETGTSTVAIPNLLT